MFDIEMTPETMTKVLIAWSKIAVGTVRWYLEIQRAATVEELERVIIDDLEWAAQAVGNPAISPAQINVVKRVVALLVDERVIVPAPVQGRVTRYVWVGGEAWNDMQPCP